MEITKETAQLIVEIYRSIYSIKHLFQEKPYAKLKEFTECGDALNSMMNRAIEGEPGNSIETNLPDIVSRVKTLINDSEFISQIHNENRIKTELKELLSNLSKLQSKI